MALFSKNESIGVLNPRSENKPALKKDILRFFKLLAVTICFASLNNASCQMKDEAFWNDLPINLKKSEEILKQDNTDEGSLDYAIFLFVYHKDNNQEIENLLKPLIEKVSKNDPYAFEVLQGKDLKFDGLDDSMIRAIKIAGLCIEPYYVIPVPFIKQKPILVRATEPDFGGNRDTFLPRCGGFKWGKGVVKSFPKLEIDEFLTLNNGQNANGSVRSTESSIQNLTYSYMIYDPEYFLKIAPKNSENSKDLITNQKYKSALNALTKYYRSEYRMNSRKAKEIAQRALNAFLNY